MSFPVSPNLFLLLFQVWLDTVIFLCIFLLFQVTTVSVPKSEKNSDPHLPNFSDKVRSKFAPGAVKQFMKKSAAALKNKGMDTGYHCEEHSSFVLWIILNLKTTSCYLSCSWSSTCTVWCLFTTCTEYCIKGIARSNLQKTSMGSLNWWCMLHSL